MIKNLTTLKELELFCKENNLTFIQGKEKGFVCTLSNIYIEKRWNYGGSIDMNININNDVFTLTTNDRDGETTIKKYNDVIATFFYNNKQVLFIFRKGDYEENCEFFWLSKEDTKQGE